MLRRRLVLGMVLMTALTAREAAGDIYHLKSPSQLETEKGSKLKLPPGYFLDEVTWQERDAALKRLQEQETRLKAENVSLRKSASEGLSATSAVLLVSLGAFFGFVAYQSTK
jgi:hypothetical protein